MLKPDEILDLFLFIEKKFDVSRFAYKGINFWPLVRANIGLNLHSNPTSFIIRRKKLSVFEIIKKPYRNFKLKKAKSNFINSLTYLKSEYILCTYPNSLYTDELMGKAYSRYIDPYFETISKKYKVQRLSFRSKGDVRMNPLFPIDFYSMEEFLIYKNLNKYINEESEENVMEFERMFKTFGEINEIVYAQFKIKPFYSGLIGQFEEVISYTDYFDELFRLSKTRYVFLECFYDIQKMAMIISGKKNGVKFIEIQHGGAEDNVYLPYDNKKIEYSILPEYLWCWSASDRDLIVKHNGDFKYLKPFIGGNMWLKKFEKSEINPVTKDQELFFKKVKEKYEKIILVCLQPIFLLDTVIKETIFISPDKYLFLVRFHPHTNDQERNKIKEELGNRINVEYEIASKANLYYLFKNCDVQLTHSSTTAMEALSFNLPTIVCSQYGYDFYKEQINDNVILFSDDSNDIISLVSKKNELNAFKTDYYKIRCDENEAIRSLTEVIDPCAA